jgi:hypothetical protein
MCLPRPGRLHPDVVVRRCVRALVGVDVPQAYPRAHPESRYSYTVNDRAWYSWVHAWPAG